MKHIISSFFLLFLLTGCSMLPKDNKNSSAFVKSAYSLSGDKASFLAYSCPKRLPKKMSNNWKEHVYRANSCVVKKRWSNVKAYGEYLSQKTPNSPWGVYYLSLYQYQKNNFEHALWLIELAKKKAPGLGHVYYQKGRILSKMKKHDMAFQNMIRATELDSSNVQAHLFLAQTYLRDQEPKRAKSHFKKVLDVEPQNELSLKYLALLEPKEKNHPKAVTKTPEVPVRNLAKENSSGRKAR